jgi:hypothetical protein
MRRIARTFFAAALLSVSALIPVAALAATTTEYVVGAEYAIGTCLGGPMGTVSGSSGSFAGVGSASPVGSVNATFDTTICWTPNVGRGTGTRTIIGGNLTLVTGEVTLVGQYVRGLVSRGVISGGYFCTEVFPVTAVLGPAGSVPEDATSITNGSAVGHLTHYGVRNAPGVCTAYAASINGVAILNY